MMNDITNHDGMQINSNMSYTLLKNENIIKKNINRSLLNGTIVEDSLFQEVTLNNADIESAKFISSLFTSCEMKNCDIHSLWAVNVTFINVIFNDASITDCTFINCIFTDCSFDGCGLSSNTFNECIFEPLIAENTSSSLNIFEKTTFSNSSMMHYFYYSVFEHCEFINTKMDSYLLGYSYGLRKDDIEKITFEPMHGCSEENDVFEELAKTYQERGLFINIGILSLNDGKYSHNNGLLLCITLLEEYIKRDYIVKADLIKFIDIIAKKLYEEKELLPAIAIISMMKLTEYMKKYNNIALKKSKSDLLLLRNNLYAIYLNYIDGMYCDESIINSDAGIEIEITYKRKPELSLTDILNSIAQNDKKAYLIKTSTGSFIEWISAYENFILTLQTFLTLLNVAIPLWIYKQSKGIKQPAQIVDIIAYEDSKIDLPTNITEPKVKCIQKTLEIIVELNLLNSEDCSGYGENNVQKVVIRTL